MKTANFALQIPSHIVRLIKMVSKSRRYVAPRQRQWATLWEQKLNIVTMYKRGHFIITVQPQHITCTQATTGSGRCFVTCRIKETFLPLTQAFSYIWANTRQWETLSTVLRQASTASPQVTSGKWWESGLYRSIFTVWRWGGRITPQSFSSGKGLGS